MLFSIILLLTIISYSIVVPIADIDVEQMAIALVNAYADLLLLFKLSKIFLK